MNLAMNRIEEALNRIEKSARSLTDRQPAGSARDEALREKVSAALAELDVLIGGLER